MRHERRCRASNRQHGDHAVMEAMSQDGLMPSDSFHAKPNEELDPHKLQCHGYFQNDGRGDRAGARF